MTEEQQKQYGWLAMNWFLVAIWWIIVLLVFDLPVDPLPYWWGFVELGSWLMTAIYFANWSHSPPYHEPFDPIF